jgi:hypothetical protein
VNELSAAQSHQQLSASYGSSQKVHYRRHKTSQVVAFPILFFMRASGPSRAQVALLLRFLDHTHTHPVRLLCTSDQTVSEAANSTTHNRQNRRKFMPSAGFFLYVSFIGHISTYRSIRSMTLYSVQTFMSLVPTPSVLIKDLLTVSPNHAAHETSSYSLWSGGSPALGSL